MHSPCYGLALMFEPANTRQLINAAALWAIAVLGSRDRDNSLCIGDDPPHKITADKVLAMFGPSDNVFRLRMCVKRLRM